MKNLFKILIILSFTCLSSVVSATPITIVSQAGNWDYNFGSTFGPGGGGSVTYADFVTGYTGSNNGQAAFGNTDISGALVQTTWSANSSLFAQTTIDLDGLLNSDATINVAIDNGVAIWINGTLAFQETAGGFTSIWEYTQSVSSAFFVDGINTISVLANDYGGATYFDMELLGDITSTAVPEPSTISILGLGMLVMGLIIRRRFKV